MKYLKDSNLFLINNKKAAQTKKRKCTGKKRKEKVIWVSYYIINKGP